MADVVPKTAEEVGKMAGMVGLSGIARVGQLPGHQRKICSLIFINHTKLHASRDSCHVCSAIYITKQTLLTNLTSMGHLEAIAW